MKYRIEIEKIDTKRHKCYLARLLDQNNEILFEKFGPIRKFLVYDIATYLILKGDINV